MIVKGLPSCLSLYSVPGFSNYSSKQQSCNKHGSKVKQLHIMRPAIEAGYNGGKLGLRVFVLSDLHTDYSENMAWVRSLSTVKYKDDVLLVAGDVAETYKNFVLTMSLLKDRFEHVFFVPGNHDLWCRFEEDCDLDSLSKLDKLLDACGGLGVQTNPTVMDGLGIIPIFSWYHESFDEEMDITGIRIPPLEMACKDFHACRWPAELTKCDTSLAVCFDAMNDKNVSTITEMQAECSQIISFSHFVPRQELCPEKRMLFYPNLPKIIGSNYLEARVRSVHGNKGTPSACHVFGHTHFCWDAVLDGIRLYSPGQEVLSMGAEGSGMPFMKKILDREKVHSITPPNSSQTVIGKAPLAYPRERKRRMNGGEDWLPFCVYSDGKNAENISPCYWSDYYSANARTPHVTRLAPWVAKFYRQPL